MAWYLFDRNFYDDSVKDKTTHEIKMMLNKDDNKESGLIIKFENRKDLDKFREESAFDVEKEYVVVYRGWLDDREEKVLSDEIERMESFVEYGMSEALEPVLMAALAYLGRLKDLYESN